MNTLLHKIRQQKGSVILICVILALFLILAITRIYSAILLRYKTNTQAEPVVATIQATTANSTEEITLPGTIKAWHEAPVYARVDGYIKQWYVDIGDKVKTGDLLAVIDAPELDAQFRQAEADLTVALANDQLAQITAKRWMNLLKTDSVSKQETDEKVDSARAQAAVVLSRRANRDRLRDLVGFERIIAPFPGIISSRRTDIGALINAGSNPNAFPLFRVAQHNPLRMYVKIPENYSSRIKPNLAVKLAFAEYPGKLFNAKLFQTAEAINPVTRTLLAQFTIQNNNNNQLMPGGYTQVHIKMPSAAHAVRLPVNVLLFRAQGLQVATLNPHQQVVLKSISIARDFGDEVEIDSGIEPGERVIINPSDSIFNGQKVRVMTDEPKTSQPLKQSKTP